MASIITADTGAVSGSAGLKQSADSSGVLALATGTGTTAVTIDASQNVGIGTSSPSTYGKLAVVGADGYISASVGSTTALTQYIAGDLAYICAAPSSGSNAKSMVFQTGTSGLGTERMRIDSSGNLLVGTTAQVGAGNTLLTLRKGGVSWQTGPTAANGNFFIANSSDVGAYIANGGTSWTANSDERLKDIIEPISDAANKVSTLRAVIGKYKKDEEGTRRSFLIAQDVQAVLPEAINENSEGMLGVQYTEVIPLLVAAIKEQQAQISSQAAVITTLTERISALEAK